MADVNAGFCQKCGRTMAANQFYTSNNLEKYPNGGRIPICKKCLTLHVDNWDPNTYLWILKEIDVPYIPDEWNKLMASYAKDRSKVTGLTILGRYLSKMKLKQFRDYRWDDTEFLQELSNNKIKQTMERSGYSAQQITEVLEKATFEIPEQIEPPSLEEEQQPPKSEFAADGTEDYFAEQAQVAQTAEELGLTEEDCQYLLLKWGKTYKPDEWVRLEQLYNEMMESYDIRTAGHIDTLKLLCKTSLKANQLVDIGDIEGFQKMSRTYDLLMKSGNFTAVQNKSEQGEFIDSIGELVALCETEGFIPRYYIEDPNDKIDETINDLKRYTTKLITEEANLGNLIELAMKNNQREDDESKLTDETTPVDEDVISEIESELYDNDFIEYNEFIDEQVEEDNE